MEYYPFPALLQSAYNGTSVFGRGTISQTENSINFTSEFIPLLPLGAKAQIEWISGDKTLYTYQGQVYLSSPNLLRLVDIDGALLAPARTVLAVNTRIEATVAAVERGVRHPPEKTARLTARILFLTNSAIKLLCGSYMAQGQQLLLSSQADFLPLNDLPLLVSSRILLRPQEALLLCEVLAGGDENFIALSAYAARLTAAAEREKKRRRREEG